MAETVYCVNHPQTETLLRCNKCGRPVCLKCVERTVVGYRCRECLGQQRVGYYNATSLDYVLATIVGLVLGGVAGVVVGMISGFMGIMGWLLLAIFGGPLGGAVVSEGIRTAIGRRRGRYVWLVGCVTIAIGGLVGAVGLNWLPLLLAVLSGQIGFLARVGGAVFLNLGFWIYLVLAVSTTYARLRV